MASPLPDLTAVLVSAQSPDAAVRQQAEAALEHLRSTQPAAYLAALAAELGGESKPAEARQIAGLILKNALDAPSEVKKVKRAEERAGREKGRGTNDGDGIGGGGDRFDDAIESKGANLSPPSVLPSPPSIQKPQAHLAAQWMSLPEDVKAQIRSTLLATLGSQVRGGFDFSVVDGASEPCLCFSMSRCFPAVRSPPSPSFPSQTCSLPSRATRRLPRSPWGPSKKSSGTSSA